MKTSFGSAALVGLALSSAMAFYAVSLHVAAERAGVDKVRAATIADLRDIRLLQAELRTRARLPELQRWNEQVLAMVPPKPGQFLGSPLMLASYTRPDAAQPEAGGAALHYAAAPPAIAPATPANVRQVAYSDTQQPAAQPTPQPVALHPVPPVRAAHARPAPFQLAEASVVVPPSITLDATLGGAIDSAVAVERADLGKVLMR